MINLNFRFYESTKPLKMQKQKIIPGLIILIICSAYLMAFKPALKYEKNAVKLLKEETIARADKVLYEKPVTITSFRCERSAGGLHDFFSEADYYWPDPANPDGPYINRDGMSNPDNFFEHRKAMVSMSRIVGSLASAYKLTGDEKYVKQAFLHLKAWFVDSETRMNPSLLYSQAIKGRYTGRGIGIIDTIHLMEVAQGILTMENARCVDKQLFAAIKTWFSEYLQWLTTHQYGKDEMNTKNNHSTCWVMQVASFAKLTGNNEILDFCRKRYREVLLPNQMGTDGSFPLEINRTKPYGYSLFNLDAMTMVCLILSDKNNDLWNYTTPDGKSIRKGIEFIYPYVADKGKWPYKKDVMYWDEWPVAHPFLLFGAGKFNVQQWYETWSNLNHFPEVTEVIRNLPVRNPVIWYN
jgi:hypothetical protein